jgi:thymidylate synthase (FAD)
MKIYLISRPTIDDTGLNAFLNDEGQNWIRTTNSKDGENIVEIAGRICHMSFGKKQLSTSNRDFIVNLIAEKHESVLEHATWTFIATGITRSLTHQIVRHRIGFSFSQMSQQYNDQASYKYIIPQGLKEDQDVRREWEKAEKASKVAYENLKKLIEKQEHNNSTKLETEKLLRSAARSVLPNCIETKLAFSANGRSIRHFIKLRGSIVWDIEMRLFCHELLSIMKKEACNLFRDFTIQKHKDGYPIILHNKSINSDAS